MSSQFDKRRAPRLKLRRPAPATLSRMSVWILDVSESGAGIEHAHELKWGEITELEFMWKEHKIRVTCDVVRTEKKKDQSDPQRTRFTGLRFCNPRDPGLQLLRTLVREALALVQKQAPPAGGL